MKNKKIKFISTLIFFLILFHKIFAVTENEYIFTKDIDFFSPDNSPYNFKININWENLSKDDFEFFKLVHSTDNPNIKYENENYIWYSEDVDAIDIENDFNDYNPNLNGTNYYRLCIVSNSGIIYCSKNSLELKFEEQENLIEITSENFSKIKTFLRDNKDTIVFIENNEYLSEKIGINTSDLEKISNQFVSLKDFEYAKKLIKTIAEDLENTKKIENFINNFESKNFTNDGEIQEVLGNLNDLLNLVYTSFETIGRYDLTLENEEKLNNFANYLENYFHEEQNTDYQEQENDENQTNQDSLEKNIDITSDGTSIDFTYQDEQRNDSVSIFTNRNIMDFLVYIGFFIGLLIFIFILFRKKINNKKIVEIKKTIEFEDNIEKNNYIKENTLQILKSNDEYIVEYNGIYNKGIKVLEKNKQNITSGIYNYVNSILKLQTRGKDLFEELNNLDIKLPNLKESGNTIYRLYIPENIRKSLKNQNLKDSLIIKTDEQEIPWEIMHDGENYLSLKYQISRKIMTRETIRKNSNEKNKIPKILFIINPTLDLPLTVKETNEIINKLGKKIIPTIISEKNVTSSKVFSFLGQNSFDIIHYSGHAYFDSKNPDNSGLILNDSVITAGEIKRILNGNPLIFLNACSSGRNDDKNFEETGEDTVGIASSFIIGGAKGVISTLWPTTDKASSDFAIEFYSLFLKNTTIGNAILKSKKEIYINHPNDITWASFMYYGDLNLKI